MGQSSSREEIETNYTENLTSLELKRLQMVLGIKDGLESLSLKQMIKNLEVHLNQHQLTDYTMEIVHALDKKCRIAPKWSPDKHLMSEVAKITHGSLADTAEFVSEISKSIAEGSVRSNFVKLCGDVIQCLSAHVESTTIGVSHLSIETFVKKVIPNNIELSNTEDVIKVFEGSPVLSEIFQYTLKLLVYGKESVQHGKPDEISYIPVLIPSLEIPPRVSLQDSTILYMPDIMYLNSQLPIENQAKWRFLYSSSVHGESFSRLSNQILGQGPVLILIRDEGGSVFGGFISTNLTFSSKFQGNERSFVFSTAPKLEVYYSTGYNDHYVYFNTGQETIPNGLGMGGQHSYFGWWLSTEFGKGHSKGKKCTTYGSPQLSISEDFKIDKLEAWAVGNKPQLEDESQENQSIIDKNPDAVAILRIAGKERHSEGLRESEVASSMPETTELHIAHDPME